MRRIRSIGEGHARRPAAPRARLQTRSMNPPDRERLVNAWLTYQKNWWAFEALMKLWRESPDEALDLIINLARSADDDELVEAVGAGRLRTSFVSMVHR